MEIENYTDRSFTLLENWGDGFFTLKLNMMHDEAKCRFGGRYFSGFRV